MYDNIIYVLNTILGLIGFLIAINIYCKKRDQKPMVCPLKMRCEQVLYSKYAKFLGIPLEILGIFYYSLITINYSIFIFAPVLNNSFSVFTIFLVTASGFLFSAYLISVQMFKLKEWCSWCLMSAAISTAIFILTLQTSSLVDSFVIIVDSYKMLLVFIYALATSLGLGLAVAAELIFLKFLQNGTISREESNTMHLLRQTTWLALGVMAVSNYALYLTDPSIFSTSPKFLAKIYILVTLVVINIVYDLFISSKLVDLFSNKTVSQFPATNYLKKACFVFGPVSLSSWLLIFIFEMVKNLELSSIQFLNLYLIVITLSIFAGLLLSKKIIRSC